MHKSTFRVMGGKTFAVLAVLALVLSAVAFATNVQADDVTSVEQGSGDTLTASVPEETISQEEQQQPEETVAPADEIASANNEENVASGDATVTVMDEQTPAEQTAETNISAPASEEQSTTERTASLESVVEDPIPAPELSTDKPDYYPGQTATIFGRFFQALKEFVLKVFGGSEEEGTYTESTQNVVSDEQGSFTTSYTLENIFRPLYTVVASTLLGDEVARTTFTDPPQPPSAGIDNYFELRIFH